MSHPQPSVDTPEDKWREVTKDEFYAAMRGNVHPVIISGWPYLSEFRDPQGNAHGRSQTYYPEGSALFEYRYYLPR